MAVKSIQVDCLYCHCLSDCAVHLRLSDLVQKSLFIAECSGDGCYLQPLPDFDFFIGSRFMSREVGTLTTSSFLINLVLMLFFSALLYIAVRPRQLSERFDESLLIMLCLIQVSNASRPPY